MIQQKKHLTHPTIFSLKLKYTWNILFDTLSNLHHLCTGDCSNSFIIMANARIIRGNRGIDSKLLVCDGFRYQLNKRRNGNMYWRCWKKDCRSGLKTNEFDLQNPNPVIRVIVNHNNHNHPHEDSAIKQADHVNEMKDAIVAEPTLPIKRVYNYAVARIHQNANQAGGQAAAVPPNIPDFHQIRSSLSRTKQAQCPPIPANINQVQIVGTFAETFLGERYLLHQDNGIGLAIFATDYEFQFLTNCHNLCGRNVQVSPSSIHASVYHPWGIYGPCRAPCSCVSYWENTAPL